MTDRALGPVGSDQTETVVPGTRLTGSRKGMSDAREFERPGEQSRGSSSSFYINLFIYSMRLLQFFGLI